MPAEQARHAKRLGHVQGQPAIAVLAAAASATNMGTTATTTQQSATSATSTSSQNPPTSASTNQLSSSALPSSSSTQLPSSAPSSATTSPTSSVAFSATPAVTAPSSSLTRPTTSTFTSLTSPSTSTSQTNAAAVTNSGLSGGAIAGIIAGAVIVGALLIVFIVRKTYLRRRERKHISWNGIPGMDEPKPIPDVSEEPASFTSAANTSQRSALLSPFEAYGQPMYSTPVPPVVHMHHPTIPTYAVPTPPPVSYNNPTSVAAYPTQPVPSTYRPSSTTALTMAHVPAGTGITSSLPAVRAQRAPVEAIVKCTFVPTLPDELSITTGERVFIVEQYDDGWDLCMNGRGERGMVPRECLGRATPDQSDIGWRNVQRISSLNPDGRRF